MFEHDILTQLKATRYSQVPLSLYDLSYAREQEH